MTTTTKNQTRLSMKETMLVGKILGEHLKPVPDTEFYAYEAGWSDEAVATMAGVSVKAVQYRRTQGFGLFPPPSASVAHGDIHEQLAALRAGLAAMEARLTKAETTLRGELSL